MMIEAGTFALHFEKIFESKDEWGQNCIRQDVHRDLLVLFRGILMLLEYSNDFFF